MLPCPACGSSTHLTYDWDAVTSVRVENGTVVAVTAGGVLGVHPDRMLCGECGTETTLADVAGSQASAVDATCEAIEEQLSRKLVDDLTDGYSLYNRPHEPVTGHR